MARTQPQAALAIRENAQRLPFVRPTNSRAVARRQVVYSHCLAFIEPAAQNVGTEMFADGSDLEVAHGAPLCTARKHAVVLSYRWQLYFSE